MSAKYYNEAKRNKTYGSVRCLLLLISLLIGGSLSFVRSLLLLGESLPLLTEQLADLAYFVLKMNEQS